MKREAAAGQGSPRFKVLVMAPSLGDVVQNMSQMLDTPVPPEMTQQYHLSAMFLLKKRGSIFPLT